MDDAGWRGRLPKLRSMAAMCGGRLELAARYERPLEALAQGFFHERTRAEREATARRDFERAWKPAP
ncbi:MAG TPA: hypothetical protein VN915_08575 [Elusimicrobiota bacterium]|nr:hypothetical protein [Elusimicrobiota bacterium]